MLFCAFFITGQGVRENIFFSFYVGKKERNKKFKKEKDER